MRKYVLAILTERSQRAICIRLVKQDFYNQLSTSIVEMARYNRLKFQQGACRKIRTDCLGWLWRCHRWGCLAKDQKFVRSKAGVFDSVPTELAKHSLLVYSTLLLHDSKINICCITSLCFFKCVYTNLIHHNPGEKRTSAYHNLCSPTPSGISTHTICITFLLSAHWLYWPH